MSRNPIVNQDPTLGAIHVIKESFARTGIVHSSEPKVMMGVTQQPYPKFDPKIEML
jgi:hypothetical protein